MDVLLNIAKNNIGAVVVFLIMLVVLIWVSMLQTKLNGLDEEVGKLFDADDDLKREGFANPYAARPLQSRSDQAGGSQPGLSSWGIPPSASSASEDESFLGGVEAPVFYDIGSVRAARTSRGGKTGVLRDADGNPVMDADGNVILASKKGQYLTSAQQRAYGRSAKEGMWAPVNEGMWTPVAEPKVENMSDEDLINR
jgi:hypothetical protein